MRLIQKLVSILILLLISFGHHSCRKLDDDGGYYDEKTKAYKYVAITKRGVKKSGLQIFSPIPGKPQQVYGIVTRIENEYYFAIIHYTIFF